ncbi:TerB family tellurite resistance protein [Rhodovulum sp. DZ06]|uniref:TerB family tellurite resistance protein n=1 Tax=Rhodovulum sp. DZ06 TaxID=3425126 RepID=UPI003D34017F
MSIWSRIADALAALRQGETLGDVFDRLRTPPEQTAGFAIAVIALGAKMAKADGQVTRDEVAAFREVFHIPPAEERNAARIFDLARTDIAGYEGYAARIAKMFGDRKEPLSDLLEGLFHIAAADGEYHPAEEAFLHRVSEIFGLPERTFRALQARYAPGAPPDPYEVLGVSPDVSDEALRRAWRAQVRESHPDRMIARGVPEEAVKLATARLAAINHAYEEAMALRGRG